MMVELPARRQRVLALALLLALVLLVWSLVISPFWTAASLHGERVAMLKRQAAAMQGLVEAAPKFDAEAKRLAAMPEIQLLTYSAEQPALAVAQLQGQLSQLFAEAPASLTSSQVIPETREGALTKIALQLTALSDMKALVKALHGIAAARPLLKVEKLVLRDPDGNWGLTVQGKVQSKLQVDIIVSAYMRAP